MNAHVAVGEHADLGRGGASVVKLRHIAVARVRHDGFKAAVLDAGAALFDDRRAVAVRRVPYHQPPHAARMHALDDGRGDVRRHAATVEVPSSDDRIKLGMVVAAHNLS